MLSLNLEIRHAEARKDNFSPLKIYILFDAATAENADAPIFCTGSGPEPVESTASQNPVSSTALGLSPPPYSPDHSSDELLPQYPQGFQIASDIEILIPSDP